MKVREALQKIFNIPLGKMIKYGYDENHKFARIETDELEIRCYNSLSNDRKVLQSNFESEVLMLDHVGMIGIMWFKMRNGQYALYLFNNPRNGYNIRRVKYMNQLKTYKELKLSMKENHNIDNDEYETWFTLKAIGGK